MVAIEPQLMSTVSATKTVAKTGSFWHEAQPALLDMHIRELPAPTDPASFAQQYDLADTYQYLPQMIFLLSQRS